MDKEKALASAFGDGWAVTVLSAANTAGVASKAAETRKCHYITGFSVLVSAADAAATATGFAVTLKDGTTTIWEDLIPVSSKIGAKVEKSFPIPVRITAGALASINCAALGAGSKSQLNLCGYTI